MIWRAYDPLNFARVGPFPIVPSVFYLLQYPFYLLAVVLLPHTRRWGGRFIKAVDGILLMGGLTALSWYHILRPMSTESDWYTLLRTVSRAFPIGDLVVLLGLTLNLLRPSRYEVDRLVLSMLVVAVLCLFEADFFAAWHLLHATGPYTMGNPSDTLWVPFHLLIPLAALVQMRLERRHAAPHVLSAGSEETSLLPECQDVAAVLRLFLPIVVALVASTAILARANMTQPASGPAGVSIPFVLCVGLLFMVVVRQGSAYLDNARLQHERYVVSSREVALRELNRRKDEFLTVASHELRTPLTSLQGYMQLLARRCVGASRHTSEEDGFVCRVIHQCQESVARIARLVNDLLDNAYIQEGRLAEHVEPCDLGTLVRSVVQKQRELHTGRLIGLTLWSGQVMVNADSLRIRQVVTNYVINAIKYSRDNLPVDVRVWVEAGVACIEVRDFGPGLSVSEQARVWERYYQSESVAVQSGSRIGLGVGLYICKHLVEAHHGQVGVCSTPGQGATFWFTLPLVQLQSK
jgi:signal transduction histidine kinase